MLSKKMRALKKFIPNGKSKTHKQVIKLLCDIFEMTVDESESYISVLVDNGYLTYYRRNKITRTPSYGDPETPRNTPTRLEMPLNDKSNDDFNINETTWHVCYNCKSVFLDIDVKFYPIDQIYVCFKCNDNSGVFYCNKCECQRTFTKVSGTWICDHEHISKKE